MKSEPTVIIEAVRAVLILLASFGVLLTTEQQSAILLAIPALFLAGSWALAWWNRQKVYSPATVEKIAAESAAAGVPTVPPPPADRPEDFPSGNGDTPPGG